MTDDVSKLPDFPLHASDEFRDMEFKAHALMLERDAYRARMEALVEHLRALKMSAHLPCCNLPYDFPCCCGLGDLLAACEREEGR